MKKEILKYRKNSIIFILLYLVVTFFISIGISVFFYLSELFNDDKLIFLGIISCLVLSTVLSFVYFFLFLLKAKSGPYAEIDETKIIIRNVFSTKEFGWQDIDFIQYYGGIKTNNISGVVIIFLKNKQKLLFGHGLVQGNREIHFNWLKNFYTNNLISEKTGSEVKFIFQSEGLRKNPYKYKA